MGIIVLKSVNIQSGLIGAGGGGGGGGGGGVAQV